MDSRNARRRFQGGAFFVLITSLFGTSLAADARRMHFDIPAGDALKTLQLYYSQTRIDLLYLTDTVRGVQTRAVSGELDPKEALRRMLEGTGLEFTFENDLSFVSIRPAEPEEADPRIRTAALPDGRAPEGAFGMNARMPIAMEELQEVTVTGTLIRGVLDIMSPLTFVTRNHMKKSSYATVQDALQQLPFNSNGGPSEDFGGQGNFGRGTSVNLRGLGAGATLVLIDGRRQPYAGMLGDFVDLSNIPWNAVERIEVLPDGASALYGSDAIAGVVNVIMRKDLNGAETLARLGAAPGGADEKLVSQLFGTQWQGGRILGSYQYSERTSLAASERTYAADTDKRPLGGSDHRSFNSSPGNILNPATLAPEFGVAEGLHGKPDLSDLLPGQIRRVNTYEALDLLPHKKTHSFYVSGTQQLGERVEVFMDGRYSQRDLYQQLSPASQILFVPSTNLYAVNPYPGTRPVAVGYDFGETLGPVMLDATTSSYSGVFGVNVPLSDTWYVTASLSHGRESLKAATRNLVDLPALMTALSSGDPLTAFNPFGENSASVIESIRATQFDEATSSVTSGNVVASGTLLSMSTGPVRLAVGGEWRTERFGSATESGDVSSPRSQFERRIESAYAELAIPVIGDADDPWAVPRLELSLAGRYERYSDFGTTANPKVGLKWAPSRSLKLRTSWGTSFKAPKLVDIYDLSRNVAALTMLEDPRSSAGDASLVMVLQGNNPDLKEETAATWTAGIDLAFDALPGFAFSLTYYEVDYKDRIAYPAAASPADILLQEALWSDAVRREPTRAEIDALCTSPSFRGDVAQCTSAPVAAIVDLTLRNLAATRVKGLDLTLDHAFDTRMGRFEMGLAGAYILSFDQAVSRHASMIDVVNSVSNPLALILRGSIDWYQRGMDEPGFNVGLTFGHSGGYADPEMQRRVDALTTVDFRLGYRTSPLAGAFSDVELNLNAANVFDRAPPFVDRDAGYDPSNFDPYGRVVSFSVQKSW